MTIPRSRPLRDASLALALMTVVPTPAQWPEGERTGVAAWFPAVGLVAGGLAWACVLLGTWLGWNGRASLVVGALVVAVWALITRMLHWDGLADVADGMWGGSTPERRLEIMSDSATGAFGATAIALVAAIEIASVSSLLGGRQSLPLLVIPALARLSASCAAWLGTPARPGGLGRSVMGAPRVHELLIAAVVVGGCLALLMQSYGAGGILLGCAGVGAALVVPHLLSMPIRGVTGDVMGASVLICEALLLAGAAVAWGV